ncbi:TIP-1 family-domain-containing protein [Lentinula aciculospora]|uniref:TIP-1 family-domain-containing protein n=1 Tax=Lentinula aciculospora TaxID=153920 RepID=A0A9W9A8V1_9AGAR|nr:TIP-1 family-domain-containing protein [Lentinula aciculospora]
MISSQICALLSAPDIEQANNEAVLFLNSKFPSYDYLEGLDASFRESEIYEAELTSNLASSNSAVDAFMAKAKTSAHSHVETAQNLSLLRHSLTDELVDLTDGLLSPLSSEPGSSTLLEDIETLHRNLDDLQGVKGYARVIEHALELSESSFQQIESMPASASITTSSFTRFQALQSFVSTIANACSSVEDGAGKQNLHVVDFLERVRDRTWVDIKARFSTPLLDAAEKLKWPMSVDYSSAQSDERTQFERAFLRLLQLQKISDVIHAGPLGSRYEGDGIYPLEVLVQRVALRFKYHFESTRPTNRPDKPEWYFTHILNVAHDQRAFLEHVVQLLLNSAGHNNINAWREFTRLLLPILKNKLRRTVPSLLQHPSLLAHTIYQALQFDAAMKEEGFELDGTFGGFKADGKAEEPWTGISDIVLGKKEWFDAWLDGEKRFVDNQYHDIISASDAWQIADDEPDNEDVRHDLRTTNSARRVKALIEQITDRYSPLPNFMHRTRFLLSMQIPLLELYLGRLASSLDAYETLSSALVRAVPGALGVSLGMKEDHSSSVNVDAGKFTSGVEGVQRLCKALLSSRSIEAAMEAWGEDLFFLELWTEIKQRPALRALAQANAALLSSTHNADGESQDTIFESLIARYDKVGCRSEDIIVQQVCAEIELGLKAHLSVTTSPIPGSSPSIDNEFVLSQTLLAPIALLSTHLTYIRATLPQQTSTPLYRRIAGRLAEHLLQRQILYRGSFTLAEGKAILAECDLWVETCRVTLLQAFGGSRDRVEAPWSRLMEAGTLVGSDGEVREKVVNATFGGTDEEQWEDVMIEVLGFNELTREEVGRILRRRE